jgi:H+/gluconate symporter-like permease
MDLILGIVYGIIVGIVIGFALAVYFLSWLYERNNPIKTEIPKEKPEEAEKET